MIDMHRELIRDGGGIIVLMCEASPTSTGLDRERLDGVKYQERFAKEAAKMASRLGIPSMLVLVGLNDVQGKSFGEVVKCDDWQELEEVPETIIAYFRRAGL
jgi:hypothetical protein